jgi:endonuclease/exonuclease/phosphatase family metal-dependent hydrolase
MRCWTVVVALLALACGGEPGPKPPEDPGTLRVVCWNVQFLPGLASRKNLRKQPSYRARRIAEEVARFDLVALQETFHDRRREQIVAGVKQAWGGAANLLMSPKPVGFAANGGCLLLTRRPILETHSIVYSEMSRPEDYGLLADGFAAKGAIHARVAFSVERSDAFVDVYVTHLEARAGHLRPSQYRELAAFIRETADPGAPVLLVGDLNTGGSREEMQDPGSQYTAMTLAFADARPPLGLTDLWPKLRWEDPGGTSSQSAPGAGRRIDYVFYADPGKGPARLTPLTVEVEPYRDPEVMALSDHSAVQAAFRWVVE